MITGLKNKLSDNILNFKGFRTKRKIVVIESDDWGSIRMPSKSVFNQLLSKGIKVDHCAYSRFDSLASTKDLDSLFNILHKYKDSNGKHPVITANSIMANPNFEAIKKSNFESYTYQEFSETLKKQFPNENVLELWKQGLNDELFYPQFHGREHLNVERWMKALKANLPETRLAFSMGLFGISTTITSERRKSYLPAFDYDNVNELDSHKEIIKDGLRIFEKTFEFKSRSFIAPNYTWNSLIEETLKKEGVVTIQGARAQHEPTQKGKVIKKYSTGIVNNHNQVFLARNVSFEPSLIKNKDWYASTISQISNAFFWNTPAIISTHRLNYIGSLEEENRSINLKLLDKILKNITTKWPEVEFMTSDKLGELILKTKNAA